MFNKVELIGRVGKNPEIRNTRDGKPIANFSIATSERWRDRQTGERKEQTEWHNVVVMVEGLARVVEQYVKKGSLLHVEGQLQTRKWQDRDGRDRWSTEVVLKGPRATINLLSGRDDDGGSSGGGYDRGGDDRRSSGGGYDRGSGHGGSAQGSMGDIIDDDIPFAPEWR